MILTTLGLLSIQAAPALAMPTLASIETLTPEAAGDVVLTGKDHEPIARIVAPSPAMNAPGSVERQMIERSVAGDAGCVRRRWTVTFFHGPGVAQGEAALRDAWPTTEAALAGPAGCPDDGYAQLADGITPAQAFADLTRLDDLRLRGAKARFTCSDETRSNLCADPKAIRQGLAKLPPWLVKREDGEAVFWLGLAGIVTEVRYPLAHPERVRVTRRVPAPF